MGIWVCYCLTFSPASPTMNFTIFEWLAGRLCGYIWVYDNFWFSSFKAFADLLYLSQYQWFFRPYVFPFCLISILLLSFIHSFLSFRTSFQLYTNYHGWIRRVRGVYALLENVQSYLCWMFIICRHCLNSHGELWSKSPSAQDSSIPSS